MIVLRNLSLALSIAILSLSAVLVTEAQTDIGSTTESAPTSSTSTEPSNRPEQAGNPNQNANQQAQPGTRVSLQTRAQERIIKLAANISNRFDATIGRYNHIMNRLETRMAKMSDAGIDTTAGAAELQTAQDSLAKAQELMADMDTIVYEAVTSESPRASWPAVKTSLRAVHTELLATHEHLHRVINTLKAAAQVSEGEEGASAAVATESEGGSEAFTNEEVMD